MPPRRLGRWRRTPRVRRGTTRECVFPSEAFSSRFVGTEPGFAPVVSSVEQPARNHPRARGTARGQGRRRGASRSRVTSRVERARRDGDRPRNPHAVRSRRRVTGLRISTPLAFHRSPCPKRDTQTIFVISYVKQLATHRSYRQIFDVFWRWPFLHSRRTLCECVPQSAYLTARYGRVGHRQ